MPADASNATKGLFTITREFGAPRALVWRAWTDPELLSQWFGPKGVTTTVLRRDFVPQGMLHARMTTPDGHVMWAKFVYQEIEEPSRLTWLHSFSDEHANVTRAPFSESWPLRLLTTVTFEDLGQKTRVTLTWSPVDATAEEQRTFEENMQSMTGGWSGSFEQLDAFLATRRTG
jgi:uncharacterized protein YndB with AHSA1/START domain